MYMFFHRNTSVYADHHGSAQADCAALSVNRNLLQNVSSCSALNSHGARVGLSPLELFFDPLLMVIMQLINFGAVIPMVQVNYPDAT